MKAEVDLTGTAAAHKLARAFPKDDARARDLTLSKISTPCASLRGAFAFQKEVNDV
jgi:hypothetical protein